VSSTADSKNESFFSRVWSLAEVFMSYGLFFCRIRVCAVGLCALRDRSELYDEERVMRAGGGPNAVSIPLELREAGLRDAGGRRVVESLAASGEGVEYK
jgi:hypothetical protein